MNWIYSAIISLVLEQATCSDIQGSYYLDAQTSFIRDDVKIQGLRMLPVVLPEPALKSLEWK